MAKRKRRHTLEVTYTNGLNYDMDRAITEIVGRSEDMSGFGIRELGFGFVVRRAAERAMERVRTVMRGRAVRCRILTDME